MAQLPRTLDLVQAILKIRKCSRLTAILLAAFVALAMPWLGSAHPAHAQGTGGGYYARWPLDINPDIGAKDISGNNNPMTLQSGAKWTTKHAPTPFTNDGALAFAPVAQSYATAAAVSGGAVWGRYTLSAWVHLNPPKPGLYNLLTLNGVSSLQFDSRGGLAFQFQVHAPVSATVRTTMPVIRDWHHLVASYDNNGVRLYVDGQLVASGPRPSSQIINPTGITLSDPTSPFDGSIDDVRIYDHSLSDAEIGMLGYTCAKVTEIPAAECQSLASLYYWTNGFAWTTHTDWDQTNTPCTWYGITCSNGHVTAINLPNNNLVGPLTPAIGDLSELTSLKLNLNHLQGSIPPILGQLSKLQDLYLSENHLAGSIPSELGQLSQLRNLYLQNNSLHGLVPGQLSQLTGNLQGLDLAYNALYATDPMALSLLNTHQPDWQNTQTVAPTNLSVTLVSSTSVILSWTPISYTADGGYYEIFPLDLDRAQSVPFTQTSDKLSHSITLTNLPANDGVKFNIHTVTLIHGLQKNPIVSEFSNISINLSGNLSPIAHDDSYVMLNTGISTNLQNGVLANDVDPDNTVAHLRAVLAISPTNGSLSLRADGTFIYKPKVGFLGNDYFTYRANDSLNNSYPAVVTLTVTSTLPVQNVAPVAHADIYTTAQDSPLTIDAAHGLLANDSDANGDALNIGAVSGINPGSIFAINLDGSFVYTPAKGYVGSESFTYQASDGQALSNPTTVTFNVLPSPSQTAILRIVLDMLPNSVANVNFTGTLGAFTLDDITPQDKDAFTNSKVFTVPAGIYTVTERLLSGYLDANISCNPPANSIADLANHQIVINAAAGANITCTFMTQRAGQIIAGKFNDKNRNHARDNNEAWLNNWTMTLHSPFNPTPLMQVTAGEGRTVFGNLFAGTYTVCETPQAGWSNVTPNVLNPTWNAPCYTVTVAPGQAVWTRFGNAHTQLTANSLDGANATLKSQTIEDIVVCDLPPVDDNGHTLAPDRDPWEEEEAAQHGTLFLPWLSTAN